MARAALRPQARGTRLHSTGTHKQGGRRFDVTPMPERIEDTREQDSITASFDSMMRSNRAAGL